MNKCTQKQCKQYRGEHVMLIQNMTKLKTCKWCGRTFRVPKTREFNATKYCCIKCSYYAYLEKHLDAQKEYLKRYDDIFKEADLPSRLGTRGLGQHREEDFDKELQKIRSEMKKMGLR